MTCSGNSVQGYAGCMDEDHEKLVFTALPAIFQHFSILRQQLGTTERSLPSVVADAVT